VTAPVIATIVKFGDQVVPIEECTWVQWAPCGCPSAVALAGHFCPTEESAWRENTPHGTQREVDADKAAGYRIELMSSARCRSEVLPHMSGKCPHEPMWGVPPLPDLPDGYVWAVKRLDGVGSRVKHAVRLGPLNDDPRWNQRGYRSTGEMLCRDISNKRHIGWHFVEQGPPQDWWNDPARVLDDALPCKVCLRKVVAS
jgi:hypothetical protein